MMENNANGSGCRVRAIHRRRPKRQPVTDICLQQIPVIPGIDWLHRREAAEDKVATPPVVVAN